MHSACSTSCWLGSRGRTFSLPRKDFKMTTAATMTAAIPNTTPQIRRTSSSGLASIATGTVEIPQFKPSADHLNWVRAWLLRPCHWRAIKIDFNSFKTFSWISTTMVILWPPSCNSKMLPFVIVTPGTAGSVSIRVVWRCPHETWLSKLPRWSGCSINNWYWPAPQVTSMVKNDHCHGNLNKKKWAPEFGLPLYIYMCVCVVYIYTISISPSWGRIWIILGNNSIIKVAQGRFTCCYLFLAVLPNHNSSARTGLVMSKFKGTSCACWSQKGPK